VSPDSGLRALDSTSTAIQFSLSLIHVGSFSISLGFPSTLALSGGSVSAGQNVTASAALSVPAQATLNISYLGTPVALPINPLGSHYDIAVPGLGYNYLGVELGLFLNLSGAVVASSNVSGPASGSATEFSWTNSGAQTHYISVTTSASDGSSVVWTLDGIKYGLSLGIDAIGSVLGFGVSIPLVSFGSLGLFPGVPPTASSSYSLPTPSTGLASLTSPGVEEGIAIVAVLVAAIAVGVVVLLRRRRNAKAPPSAP